MIPTRTDAEEKGTQEQGEGEPMQPARWLTPNPPTNMVGFRGFDASAILDLRGDIPRPIGDLPESLSQAMLVGIMLVGRLAVLVTSALLMPVFNSSGSFVIRISQGLGPFFQIELLKTGRSQSVLRAVFEIVAGMGREA